MLWQILNKDIKSTKSITTKLLENRGIKTKKEINNFLDPKDPDRIKIYDLGIKKEQLQKILKRLQKAKEGKEKIVVFGDYDADGVCATAILWETLYKLDFNALPYIPDRFSEGYGLKKESLEKINAELIITVDNGIVAYDAITEAKKRKIDVIVVDHHTKGNKKLNTEYVLHSTAVCGSALAWFLSCKVRPCNPAGSDLNSGLDLVALGTIADQMPLLGVNRSLVKFGLPELSRTKRTGLQKLFKDSKLKSIGVYEVGYVIAPRINAMGRLASATDSLRFLCTRDLKKANDLNKLLNETNIERQKVVDEVLTQVLKQVQDIEKIIVISGKYHEGVIGLASGKVTEKYYKPSVVLSVGEKVSKASARSINGFNIIEAIKKTGLIIEGATHPMAAGFSIESRKIEDFRFKINEIAQKTLTDEILEKKLKIDLELNFELINKNLTEELKKIEPTGLGNFQPIFMTRNVEVVECKPVGQEGKHLKLKLRQNSVVLDAIWFSAINKLKSGDIVNVAYIVEENVWNNKTSIQLKIRDIMNDKDIN